MLKNSLDSYIVTSRVRLARNLTGYPFVPKLSVRDADHLVREASAALEMKDFRTYRLRDETDRAVEALKERHLVSSALIRNRDVSAIALGPDARTSVMLVEEDHLRIQCILEGLELERAYEEASEIDDDLSLKLRFAYHEKYGFLTSCPTNLGTGMRASVMMFLPGLNLTGGISELAGGSALPNMTFRGVYGEGTDAEGFLYQLSNRSTLGLSESEIVRNVKESIDTIARLEERARERLLEENRTALTDRIFRAWGLLTNSYVMPAAECAGHLSFVKLGVCLDLIRLRDARLPDRLTVECRPATLDEEDGEDSDVARARKLREELGPARLS